MYTYQDFLRIPDNEKMNFVRSIINAHTSSKEYKFARTAEAYYMRRNETIMNFQKLIYTVTGRQVPDNYSTNYKLRSNWLNYFTVQLNQYLLSNGITWKEEKTADALGDKFDLQIKKLSRYALVHGCAFGFWNLDHLEPYSLLEFAPLYDEENGALMAGVRFWRLDAAKPLRATLFELDGYTEYQWNTDTEGKEYGAVKEEKRSYIQIAVTTEAEGTIIYDGRNYPLFPIIPLYGIEKQSELEGRKELIDCFDLIASGFANSVEEASYIYWAIQNADGMRDGDLAKFVEKVKMLHVALASRGNGATAEPHSIEAPYASRTALLNELREELFYSFKAFDAKQIQSSGAVIAQIDAAYEALDQKASDYEDNIYEFLDGVMAVTGIEDTPTITRSKISNTGEQIQNILQAGDHLPDEYITKKLLTLFGDGDLADEIIREKDAEDMMTISQTEPNEYEAEDYEPTGQEDEGVDDSTDEDEQYLQEVVDMLDELLEEIDNG